MSANESRISEQEYMRTGINRERNYAELCKRVPPGSSIETLRTALGEIIGRDPGIEVCQKFYCVSAEGIAMLNDDFGRPLEEVISKLQAKHEQIESAENIEEKRGLIIRRITSIYQHMSGKILTGYELKRMAVMPMDELRALYFSLVKSETEINAHEYMMNASTVADYLNQVCGQADDSGRSDKERAMLYAASIYAAIGKDVGAEIAEQVADEVSHIAGITVGGAAMLSNCADIDGITQERAEEILQNIGICLLYVALCCTSIALTCGYVEVGFLLIDWIDPVFAGGIRTVLAITAGMLWGPIIAGGIALLGCCASVLYERITGQRTKVNELPERIAEAAVPTPEKKLDEGEGDKQTDWIEEAEEIEREEYPKEQDKDW